MAQIGVGTGDNFDHGGNGAFGDLDIGLEELFVPPLESVNVEEKVKTENTNKWTTNNNTLHNTNNVNHYNNNNARADNLARVHGNCWEVEELRMGEWDLEELMTDVPSFPLVDIQIQ